MRDSAPTEDLLPQLRELFFFRQWSPEDLAQLAAHVRLVRKRKEQILFLQNEECKWLYVLLRGQVQMFVDSEDGREITLHMLRPQALVACAALFLGKAYPASARSVSSDTELLAIEGDAFLKLLSERPDLSKKMIASLASRISELAARLESHTSENADQRLAQWLLDQPTSKNENGERIIRLTGSKKALSADLGMVPETFSRALAKLSRGGALRVEGKVIVVLDARQLTNMAEGR